MKHILPALLLLIVGNRIPPMSIAVIPSAISIAMLVKTSAKRHRAVVLVLKLALRVESDTVGRELAILVASAGLDMGVSVK